MFWIKGYLEGQQRRLTYGNGELGGDQVAQYRLRQLAKQKQELGLAVGLPGAHRVPAELSSEYAVYALAVELFSERLTSGGAIPQIGRVPEGAQA